MRPPADLHAIEWDHPHAGDRTHKPTVCGRSVDPSLIATTPDAVTCPDCRAEVDRRESIEF